MITDGGTTYVPRERFCPCYPKNLGKKRNVVRNVVVAAVRSDLNRGPRIASSLSNLGFFSWVFLSTQITSASSTYSLQDTVDRLHDFIPITNTNIMSGVVEHIFL